MPFHDRGDAGRALARELGPLDLRDPIVLAMPRGGVPVGYEVARALAAPLDVFVARKIGAPAQPEWGIGAIAEGGAVVVDHRALTAAGLSEDQFAELVARERAELERRVRRYRGDRALPDLSRHDVVLVDDGLATGVTAEAALRALRRSNARASHPRRLILAVPVCAHDTAVRISALVDEIVCVARPDAF